MSDEKAQNAYEPQPRPPAPEPPPGGWRPGREFSRDPSFGFDPRSKNAVLACFLSLMPGLGQIYVGFYQRGFLHILVVGSTIAILAEEPVRALTPLLGIFLPFFWLYNVIDAGRRAGLYNHALRSGGTMDLPLEIPGQGGAGGAVFGGAILIGLGFLLLMYTRFGLSLQWLHEWWPLGPIVFGAWLVAKGLAAGKIKKQDG